MSCRNWCSRLIAFRVAACGGKGMDGLPVAAVAGSCFRAGGGLGFTLSITCSPWYWLRHHCPLVLLNGPL